MRTMILDEETIAAFGRQLCTNEKSSRTVEKYMRDAEAFRRFAKGRALGKALTVDYKKFLIESGRYADSSINSMIASLRGLFKFLERDDCNVAHVRTQETPYCPENSILTMDEYQRLLRAAEGDRRLQMILKVMFGTGIRVSELGCFTVEAMKKSGQHTTIRVSCKKKNREILLTDQLREELLAYIDERGISSGPIFCTRSGKPLDRSNLWKQVKHLCVIAGVDEGKVFPHNIRKLFARSFYEDTHDLAQLSCLLGHSSVNTTMIYIKRSEGEVREKVERMMEAALYRCGEPGTSDEETQAAQGQKPGSQKPQENGQGQKPEQKKAGGQEAESQDAQKNGQGQKPERKKAGGQEAESQDAQKNGQGQKPATKKKAGKQKSKGQNARKRKLKRRKARRQKARR